MNKLIALSIGVFFLALLIPLHAQEVEDREPLDIEFRAGTQLLYIVEAGGTKYNFDVTLTHVGESIAFDYTMSAPANLAGSVTISSEALENAERMVNYFNGGELNLTNATTVFLSKDLYLNGVIRGEVEIYLDDEASPTYFGSVVSPGTHKLVIDGQEESLETTFIASLYYDEERETEDYDKVIVVLNNPDFPLIVRLDIGFSIRLMEVKNAK